MIRWLRRLNAALRFTLELMGLTAIGYWGFHMGDGWMGWLSGITLPLLFAIAWGMFGSPRAPFPLPQNGRLMLESLIFGLPGALLMGLMPVTAIIYLIGVVLNRVLIVYWKQENLIHT
ncbi:hypothetical protein AF331_11485 [Rossellomorea marisflavi]|uniref:DUF2568 domain-containing protein n=1 Tax=Rossellomorea marisflavi TaxID=189381 RepID=A0A0M0G487_9BACI|nr:YrdB family protein [Rossellomorea marisflavi]KON84650.1 hypothetical protein AF331_11485 [Rossellomorea marisflavi]